MKEGEGRHVTALAINQQVSEPKNCCLVFEQLYILFHEANPIQESRHPFLLAEKA